MRYGQGFGAAGESEVRVEWRLTPRWNLQSGASSSGASSVDLIWSFDY